MSIRKGISIIAGNGGSGSGSANLLDFKWADHLLNDVSWLRADTFSWQDGNVYSAVYQHLVADIVGKSLQSETIAGTTIQFYLADDGHKVTTDESGVLAIYNATGVAWYYVLDAVNTRFKLPRTKFGFTGIRDGVGAPVQERATQMYLYFYVGNYTHSAIEQTAGLNAELFNGKADVNMVAHVVIEFQEPTAENGYTWYRKYADGWVEQGGNYNWLSVVANRVTITYPVIMADNINCLFITRPKAIGDTGAYDNDGVESQNTTGFVSAGFSAGNAAANSFVWQVSGKYAQE